MDSGNPFLRRKILSSKTSSKSNCYYTPHPDGQHKVYRWTTNGGSNNVQWYACAGCKGLKQKDKIKYASNKVPNATQNKETESWIVNPLELNGAHFIIIH